MSEEGPFLEFQAEESYLSPFETWPIDGYIPPDHFPNCCDYHRHVFAKAEKWFERFPNCCENHKKLAKRDWFDKRTFEGVPKKVVTQLSYTEYHISQRIGTATWYEDITAYIDYNIHSFGHPEVGLGEYLPALRHYISNAKPTDYDFPQDKREKLLEFIKEAASPRVTPVVSFNLLYKTFQKWLSIFPDLQYFKQLKEELKGKFPANLMFYEIRPNPYWGLATARVRTEVELVELLEKITKQLLNGIEAVDLVKKGGYPDIDRHAFEVVCEDHRIKQTRLVGEFSKGEIKYVKIIKKWLLNEKTFFLEIQSKWKHLFPKSKISKEPESPPEFNPDEVKAILRVAFERTGVYSDGVKVVGKKRHDAALKAAFRALVTRSYLAGDNQGRQAFEQFSKKVFPPGISSRALSDETEHEKPLVADFLARIPHKE